MTDLSELSAAELHRYIVSALAPVPTTKAGTQPKPPTLTEHAAPRILYTLRCPMCGPFFYATQTPNLRAVSCPKCGTVAPTI